MQEPIKMDMTDGVKQSGAPFLSGTPKIKKAMPRTIDWNSDKITNSNTKNSQSMVVKN